MIAIASRQIHALVLIKFPNQTYDIVCEGIARRLVRILEVP